MKLVTYFDVDTGDQRVGVLDEHGRVLDLTRLGVSSVRMIDIIAGGETLLNDLRAKIVRADGSGLPHLDSLQLLAPIPDLRRNIFCAGRNYRLHVEEGAKALGYEIALPTIPEFFTKSTGTVIGHKAAVESHSALTSKLDYEVELAVVIGKRGRDIPVSSAMSYVFGYTVVNDISARDRQMMHGQWFKGKSYDTFCPMGPCIVTADQFGKPSGHRISLTLNGELRQDSDTSELLFSVPELIASLSEGFTLLEGDVIATGTPAGVILGMKDPKTFLRPGDVMVAEVEGIGKLENTVK